MITLLFGLLFSGCAARPAKEPMYYYGRYSHNLYTLEKHQTEEALLTHRQGLEIIISEAGTRNLPIPPGIYAELGYIHFKANNHQEAITFFQAEAELYPESKILMDRLIENAQALSASGSNDAKGD